MPRPESGSPRSLAGLSKIVAFEPLWTDSNRQNFSQFKKQKDKFILIATLQQQSPLTI